MLDWIASALSPEQAQPFTRLTTNASILAAAGSGKTRTLVNLLAADLAAGVPASNIVAFTFTEKAAEELLARVHLLCKSHLPDTKLTGMYVGTIHAWCLQYLQTQSDFYNFTSVDELHVDALVSRLYDALALENVYGLTYPRGIDKFLADVEVFYNEHLTLDQVPENVRPSIAAFLDVLRHNRLMTFGGMVRFATEHLQTNGPVKELRALYVDEYQDVNPAQVALIKAMLPDEAKVVVVGDDLQCIYQWRGSDVTRILNFSAEFNDVSVFRLSTNYRARPHIVTVGNSIAENVSVRDPEKTMKAGRDEAPCDAVHWLSLYSEEEQAQAVVEIVERFAAEGVPYNKIAVLLRSVVGAGKPIVDALNAKEIPVYCPILSRGGEFIDEFLLPVFDWLRKEHNEPKNEAEEAEAEEAANNLWRTVQRWILVENAEDVFWDGLNAWLDGIEKQRSDTYNVRGRLYDFLNLCGIRISPDDSNLMVGLGIASQIIRSVEEIHRRRLQGQQRRTPRGVISEIYFALVRKQLDFGESIPINQTTGGVLVTTVHQAKGLEWPVVIIPMLVNRRFPVTRRGHGTSFPDEIAERYGTSLEDERRLFYVAATRARERLFLLDTARGKDKSRSAFLHELQGMRVIDVTDLSEIDATVWQIDKEDLKEDDPAPLRIGLSDLLLYVECPYQFALRRIAAVQASVGDELGFGQGLHELIRRQIEAEDAWDDEELRQQVDEHVFLPLMSEKAETQSRRAIEKRVKQLSKLGVFAAKVDSEVAVEILMDRGIIHGIIDGIQLEEDGTVRVRDWKSNIHDNLVPRYERQLQFYAEALRLEGRTVSRADIVDVAASAEQDQIVAREIEIHEGAIRALVDILQQSLNGIAEGTFPATPNPISCSSCDMYRICPERYTNDEAQ